MPKPAATPTTADVNRMARWLHSACLHHLGKGPTWIKITGAAKDRYHAVARQLLTAPPAVLVKAVRLATPKE